MGLFSSFTFCATTPKIVGKWKEIGKTATLEFRKDGSFKAVDNQGMTVTGKYALLENGMARFEIAHQQSLPETVAIRLSVQKDELTITPAGGNEVERYRRVK